MPFDTDRPKKERAILIGLARNAHARPEVENSLSELSQLALSAGAEIISQRIQTKSKPNPRFYVGEGFIDSIREELKENEGNCVIFDDTLSPAQQRNIETALEIKVVDRPILILDIFATRARSAAARLQVELAQLEYTLPRLTGAWVHFSRQYGGIGSKGPGETQLEIDRRQIRKKITSLKKKLVKLDRQRATQRKSRQELFKIALVGYTNAGKSTLFNQLTKANVTVENRLFTTLDATTRVMSSGYPCRVLFSDTVGFIRKLPHQLVESFKSTLEEVTLADLLLHVVDCTDPELGQHMSQTKAVLKEIGAEKIRSLLVINKIDQNREFAKLPDETEPQFLISARKGEHLAALKAEIIAVSGNHYSAKSSQTPY